MLIVRADVPGYPVLRYIATDMDRLYGLVLNGVLDGTLIPLPPSLH